MTRHFISRSLWRKLAVMCIACVGFVLLYEVSTFDSREAAPLGVVDPTRPTAGSRLRFTATAYCKGTTTASGVGVRTGIAASDPALLPVGSVVNISTDTAKYNGVYTIMDTGPRVLGRILDIYMWSCHEALAFGRRAVEVTVLRLGWNPSASTPSLVERLFRRREATKTAAPEAGPEGAHGVDGPVGAKGASEGATFDGVSYDGATGPIGEPPYPAPSDPPSYVAPSSTAAPAPDGTVSAP